MDENEELLHNFEEILKKGSTSKIQSLYSDKTIKKLRKIPSISPRDILDHVSSKIKAINKADCVECDKRAPVYLKKYEKSTFLPVNMLSRLEVSGNNFKYYTERLSESQNIIDRLLALIDAAYFVGSSSLSNECLHLVRKWPIFLLSQACHIRLCLDRVLPGLQHMSYPPPCR